MKIAVVGLSPKVGGVETFIINMFRSLYQKHDFYFLTSYDEDVCYKDEILKNNGKIIKYCPRRSSLIKCRKDLNKFFKSNRVDVLWFNCCSLSSIEEIKIAYKNNISNIVVHSHNSKNMGSKLTFLSHTLNKLILNRFVYNTIACSNIAADWMFNNTLRKNTKILHNAVNAKKFQYNKNLDIKMRKKLNIEKDCSVIGHVGRFHFQKNHKFLINIYEKYYKINKNSRLILCGEGEDKASIKEYVKQKNIENNVLFLGNRNDMEQVYQCMNMIVFPSLFEGLPFVLIEAQASGIPCLISDNISREVAITNLIHFKSLSDDPELWANCVKNLIVYEKKSTLDEIVKAGYDIEENVKNFEKILKLK